LHYNVGKCVFLPLQQDFHSKSRHTSPRISVRSTPMITSRRPIMMMITMTMTMTTMRCCY